MNSPEMGTRHLLIIQQSSVVVVTALDILRPVITSLAARLA
jgi:hypothetical protein